MSGGDFTENFYELAESRYSVRAYKNIPVEDGKVEKILKAAQLAPTARNYQPQKIYVLKSGEARQKLAAVCPCTFNAPLVFVVCYDETKASESKVYSGHNFGNTDAAIVCSHMMFEAWDLGLGCCWVGWFSEAEVREALSIPENIRVCDILPVGYAADDAKPSVMHTTSRSLDEMVEYK